MTNVVLLFPDRSFGFVATAWPVEFPWEHGVKSLERKDWAWLYVLALHSAGLSSLT